MDSQRIQGALVVLLTTEERAALLRVLRVVQDNWWLDEVEQTLLERLEDPDAAFLPAA